MGQVWEWTGSTFGGYPGFVAYPYREYSEVFFGEDYRVLRGGSWATSPRVRTLTFRNWDLPQRRQIFAGVRLARDCVTPSIRGTRRECVVMEPIATPSPPRSGSTRTSTARRSDRSPTTCSTG